MQHEVDLMTIKQLTTGESLQSSAMLPSNVAYTLSLPLVRKLVEPDI